MKKSIISLFVLILLCSFVVSLSPKTTQASAKSQIKKLVNKMKDAEYSLATAENISQKPGSYKIKLTKDRMARLAAVTYKRSEKNGVRKDKEFDDYDTFTFPGKYLKKTSKNLFGKSLKMSNITTKESEMDSFLQDVYRQDSKALIYSFPGETELDFAVRNISIKKNGSSYKATKNVFCDYWGKNDGKSYNYQFVYTVKKNSKSSYGYVITGITVKLSETLLSGNNGSDKKPFYGIWCGSSKNKSDLDEQVKSLKAKGFDAKIFVTTDWENLNSEKWYVVSAGVYSSKGDADAELSKVKKVYSGAYVKYTGGWKG